MARMKKFFQKKSPKDGDSIKVSFSKEGLKKKLKHFFIQLFLKLKLNESLLGIFSEKISPKASIE